MSNMIMNQTLESSSSLHRRRDFKLQRTEHNKMSEPIPMKRITRSNSELELYEDEKAAQFRDYCMYVRILNGRRGHKESSVDSILEHYIDWDDSSDQEGSPFIRKSMGSPIIRSTAKSHKPQAFNDHLSKCFSDEDTSGECHFEDLIFDIDLES
mmetsp:Transcript_26446/g.39114  ORF Transcript_26446/g.39114 Transcript_26446/m.39114 type:complete len:154 (-) Transcript_26446:85-546(-)